MLTRFLTEEEREKGISHIYKFQAFNGIGFNFMGETPVYLMAIHFGASNIELGYISSVIFLSGFILVVLPRLLAGKNIIKVQYSAWFIRGFIVLLYLFLFFLKGRPAVILILIVYTLFCSARIVGVVIWNPMIKILTTSQNRGVVLAQGSMANQGASVISKLVSFLITSFQYFSGIIGIMLLQVIGVIFNTVAALQLMKIPCRETVEYQKSRNLFVILKEALGRKDRRNPLLLKWVSIAVLVLNGLTIVFLRKEAGFNASLVFLYTMVLALANISSGFFARAFADRIGSRPLLIGMNIFLSLSLVIWLFLPVSGPESIPVVLYFIIGYFSNFFLLSTNVLIARVLVNTMPEEETFSYNAMINFIMAFFSFISGLTGGLLIDMGHSTGFVLPNTYSFLFFTALILSLIMVLLSTIIIDKGSLTAKETVGILFSLEGLKAFNYIGKLNATEDPVKKKTVILSISRNDAQIATEEMRTIMASPLSPEKGEVLKSLFNHPRPLLLPDLLKEAADSGSYHQSKAIFALGAYSGPEVDEVLMKILLTPESSVRSNAAKALGRTGNKDSVELVRNLASKADAPMDKINYLIALKNMDEKGLVFLDTFKSPVAFSTGLFKQTYYSLVSDLLDMKPRLSEIYNSKNLKTGGGLEFFLEQTRDLDTYYRHHKNLIQWFSTGQWPALWTFCLTTLMQEIPVEKTQLSGIGYLKKAVITESRRRIPMINDNNLTAYDDALAAVFFTYQILLVSINR